MNIIRNLLGLKLKIPREQFADLCYQLFKKISSHHSGTLEKNQDNFPLEQTIEELIFNLWILSITIDKDTMDIVMENLMTKSKNLFPERTDLEEFKVKIIDRFQEYYDTFNAQTQSSDKLFSVSMTFLSHHDPKNILKIFDTSTHICTAMLAYAELGKHYKIIRH